MALDRIIGEYLNLACLGTRFVLSDRSKYSTFRVTSLRGLFFAVTKKDYERLIIFNAMSSERRDPSHARKQLLAFT